MQEMQLCSCPHHRTCIPDNAKGRQSFTALAHLATHLRSDAHDAAHKAGSAARRELRRDVWHAQYAAHLEAAFVAQRCDVLDVVVDLDDATVEPHV